MKQINTYETDPWVHIRDEFETIQIIQRGQSVKYKLPNGLILKYFRDPAPGVRKRKMYAFQKVRKDALIWIEGHDGDDRIREKIVGKNEHLLGEYPTYFGSYYFDVKAAYWETARMFGVISEETYEEFKDEKFLRNACIGALASKTLVFQYDRKTRRKELIETIENPTRTAYYSISNFISERMRAVSSQGFMYWVDCIYTPFSDVSDLLRDCFPKDFDFTKKICKSLRYDKQNQIIFTKLEGDTKTRPYYFCKSHNFLELRE